MMIRQKEVYESFEEELRLYRTIVLDKDKRINTLKSIIVKQMEDMEMFKQLSK